MFGSRKSFDVTKQRSCSVSKNDTTERNASHKLQDQLGPNQFLKLLRLLDLPASASSAVVAAAAVAAISPPSKESSFLPRGRFFDAVTADSSAAAAAEASTASASTATEPLGWRTLTGGAAGEDTAAAGAGTGG